MLEIKRDNSALLQHSITDAAGEALDLSGWTITFTANCFDKTITKTNVTSPPEITVTGTGAAQTFLTADDTDELGVYAYDVQIENGTLKETVEVGKFKIVDTVKKL